MSDIDNEIEQAQRIIENKTPCCGAEYTGVWVDLGNDNKMLYQGCIECEKPIALQGDTWIDIEGIMIINGKAYDMERGEEI